MNDPRSTSCEKRIKTRNESLKIESETRISFHFFFFLHVFHFACFLWNLQQQNMQKKCDDFDFIYKN